MNHTAYRHLSMPCPVMRGSLRFMPEGSGESEIVGGGWRWCSGLCGADYFGDLQRVRAVAKQIRSWATTPTIPPTPSSSPASATGWGRGRRHRRPLSRSMAGAGVLYNTYFSLWEEPVRW